MDPPHIFRHAIELGIEVIAITDHNSTANLPAFMSDPPKGLWVIPGMELQTKEEVHLLCLFPTLAAAMDFGQTVDRHLPDLAGRLHQAFGEQTKVNRFGEKVGEEQKLLLVSTDFSLSEAFAQVAFFHGITYPAHADRPAFGILGQLGFIPSDLPVKTVEISAHLNCTAGRGLFPGFQLVQSSDAHRLAEMGRGCSMLRMARPCWEEFMAAVSGGNGRAIEI